MKWIKGLLTTLATVVVLGLAGILVFGPRMVADLFNPVRAHDSYPVSDAAAALHADLFIADMHADPLLWSRDLTKRSDRGHVDIPRLIEGNVGLQVFTAVTKSPAGLNYDKNDTKTFDMITALAVAQRWPPSTWGSLRARAEYQAEKLSRFAERSDGALRIVKNRADLDRLIADRARGAPVVGGLLGIEGAHPLEGDLSNLDLLVDAGHRLIGLQHFFDNAVGGSLHGTTDAGLTDLGRALVAEIEARGLILDLAHSSPGVVREVLTMTDMPVILSHGGVQSHCETNRNLTDDLMQQIAARGGVVGMGYWNTVTCGDSTPTGVARLIVTAVNLLGADHVALGSDFDGAVGTDFDTSELAALTHALIEAGLSDTTVRKVMGGNVLRVFSERLR